MFVSVQCFFSNLAFNEQQQRQGREERQFSVFIHGIHGNTSMTINGLTRSSTIGELKRKLSEKLPSLQMDDHRLVKAIKNDL